MSGQWHPDAEALAKFQAGLTDDLAALQGMTPAPPARFRDRRLAAHVARCARCAATVEQLTEVSSVLASVPAPAMPDSVERRVTAALAAEAAARGTGASEAGAPAGAAPRAAGARRRRWRPRPVMMLVPAVACLLLAGFGYLLSSGTSPAARSTGSQAAAPETPVRGGASSPGQGSAGKAISPSVGLAPAEGPGQAPFVVSSTGTSYQKATLAAQVRSQLASRSAAPAPSASPPAAHTGAAGSQEVPGSGPVPSRALVGCVLHVTGNVAPSLVDRATYQGKPAYVIAVPDRAWVVGPDCTASNSALITSISLAAAG